MFLVDVYISGGGLMCVCVIGLRKIPVCITFFKLCFLHNALSILSQMQNTQFKRISFLFFRSVIVEQRSESEM